MLAAAAALADARFIELIDCGHVTYAEQADAFAHAATVFAAGLDRRARSRRLTKERNMTTNSVTELTAKRFDVRSTDGTAIAVRVDGDGPALVMVHGSTADHTTFYPLVAVLRRHVTTYCMDRRGFGASGNTPTTRSPATSTTSRPSSTPSRPAPAGPSPCGATPTAPTAPWVPPPRPENVHHLVLYEPSLGVPYPPGSTERLRRPGRR